jgi:hypothetical protein
VTIVFRPVGSLANPFTEEILFILKEAESRVFRWYSFIRVRGENALDDGTVGYVTPSNGRIPLPLGESILAIVQTKPGLAYIGVRSVALVAFIREEGPDVPCIINGATTKNT